MFGLNLIHVGFLAAGLAAALPILIHLLFRQRTRTVSIGSLRFLHQVVKEHRRRRRVRQWVLLAMRMLAVLLLALLFARPYFDTSRLGGLEKEVVILVDASASMQAKGSKQVSVFEQAKAAAREELSKLDENVIVHLATFDATQIQEIPIERFAGIKPTDAATDLVLALSWARDLLNASTRQSRRIVLISDLQRTGLPRTPIDHLPESMDLVIRDVSESMTRNVSIASVESLRTEIRPDGKVLIRVLLRNHAPLPVRQLRVKCEINHDQGNPFQLEETIDIPGNGNIVLDFPLAIEKDGLYQGRASIDLDDALAIDNERWIAFEARHPDRVLLVDGQEGRSVFSNETYYLETALRLQTEEANGQVRSFEADRIVWEAGEGFPRLDGFRAIVLANVRRLSKTDGERLDAYVRGGGSLVIFAGDQVDLSSLAPIQEQGLLPGTLADAAIEGRLRINRWDAKHPALACFADPQQGDLRRIQFHKLLAMKSLEPDSRGLLFVGDHPVVVERAVGKGRCLYFGSTADRDWTELPRTPMYVPLMRQFIAYLTDQLEGRSLVMSHTVSKPGERVGITKEAADEERWIVTNLDSKESELERITEDDLLTMVGADSKGKDSDGESALRLTMPRDSLRSDEIWTIVAWCLLFLLAAEMLLAGQIHA
jgi:hypothetical protein